MKITDYAYDKDKSSRLVEIVSEKFGMQGGRAMDFVSGRMSIENASLLEKFALYYAMDQIDGSRLVKKSFAEEQINLLSKQKFSKERVEFPMKFHCIQITEDQWIGKISVSELVGLYNAQLIHYNVNAQRVMKRIVRGGNVTYRIAINQHAVKQIHDLMKLGRYIPNTITLNIPVDADYLYDKQSETLLIKSADYFDIADGYHRLLALRKLYEEDRADFNMELRLVSFRDDKTQQFIFQEDQKTKMAAIESASLNRYDIANSVVRALNEEDYNFCWSGNIRRDGGLVNFADLACIVSFFYVKGKDVKSGQERQTVNRIKNDLYNKLNTICDAIPDIGELNYSKLMLIVYCARTFEDSAEMVLHVQNGLASMNQLDKNMFSVRRPRKAQVKEIQSII